MEDQMYVFNRIRIANPTDLIEARQLAVTIADAATKIVRSPLRTPWRNQLVDTGR
jgi:hypothetical protein